MSARVDTSVAVVERAFVAVMARDHAAQEEIFHPDLDLLWPPSLSSSSRTGERRPTWEETWDPLQPTAAERDMSPRVVAANEDGEVVVLWRQRGVRDDGARIECPVLGLYRVEDGRLVRGQMFYFDTVAVLDFLRGAGVDAAAGPPHDPMNRGGAMPTS